MCRPRTPSIALRSPDRLRRLSRLLVCAGLGACSGLESTRPTTGGSTDSLVGVAISPDHATLVRGETLVLTAVALTSAGTSVPAAPVTWSSADPAVASISPAGVVQAVGVGATVIRASLTALDTTALVTVLATAPQQPQHAGYFASPAGSATAAGTLLDPWDLATALAPPDVVQPGDTIWLRNGVYHGCFISRLTGTSSKPIVVRGFPHEQPVIDGAGCEDAPLSVFGGFTWYWGLEVRNSSPLAGGGNNVNLYGEEVKAINLVVRDASNSGIGFWSEGAGGEVYGCLIFNNGTKNNLDHGIYMQNAVGTKRVADNIIFDQWGFGIHAYGSSSAALRGFLIEGNVLFNNGQIGTAGSAPNILIGGGTPAQSVTLRDNMTYHAPDAGTNVRLGYDADNVDVTVDGNRFVGGSPVLAMRSWSSAVVRANLFVGSRNLISLLGSLRGFGWSGNRQYAGNSVDAYWEFEDQRLAFVPWTQATGLGGGELQGTSSPASAEVIVRPNQYQPGRANIVVYNWAGAPSTSVDVSTVVAAGDSFEIRNAQTYFGPPVIRGIYPGGPVTIPLAPVTPTPPLGRASQSPPSTSPLFGVFVVLSGAGL